jgi:DNA polymerase
MSGCELLLKVYREGKSVYTEFALEALGATTIAEAKSMKPISKVTCLGCGYGMGWRRFIIHAAAFGVKVTEGEAQRLVLSFRTVYKEIEWSWRILETAVINALLKRGAVEALGHVIDATDPRAMSILLPSHRKIWYRNAALEVVRSDNGAARKICYDHRDVNRGMKRIATWGGKLVENVVQAGCRDLVRRETTSRHRRSGPFREEHSNDRDEYSWIGSPEA